NAAIAEYSTTELVEVLERLESSRRLTGSQSNITAMQSNSKFFERSKFQNQYDTWELEDLFSFVDKDDEGELKFLIQKSVSAYYDKADGTLKMDHILSNRVTTDLMILSTVEIKKNQEPAKTFLSTLDVNTRTILESFVLKLEAVQAEMHVSSDNRNHFLETVTGKRSLNQLVSIIHNLHFSIMKRQLHPYQYFFSESIHCLYLMCKCIKVTSTNEGAAQPRYFAKFDTDFTNKIAILQHLMRMTVVFEIYHEITLNNQDIQYRFLLSLVNTEFEGTNGVSKTSFSLLQELMKLATA
ncbi:hypothetical protein HK099_003305, partial [Clydaea vesicula]